MLNMEKVILHTIGILRNLVGREVLSQPTVRITEGGGMSEKF